MIKATLLVLVLLTAVACGTAPTRSNAQPFTVISEQADPAAGSLILLIRVSGPATEANVRSAVESAIASRKGDYRRMVVKSYLEGMTESDTPFATSRFEDGSVTHRFNAMAETQRIPTH
jgi:hypothetical protein